MGDVPRMAELGPRYVRTGEFAWSAIEPGLREDRQWWVEGAVETPGGLRFVRGQARGSVAYFRT
jgi:hypothetical protein